MNYYISDLHLFCRSQVDNGGVNYDGRPFKSLDEMHDYFLRRWNEKITNGDTVYILGDVAMRGKNDALIALVAQLKGKKVLVKGNHDDLGDYRYKQLFYEVVDYKELSDSFEGKTYKVVLSHYPILMWNGQHSGTTLLYGHTHNSAEDKFFQGCLARMNRSEELKLRRQGEKPFRAINVGCMMPYMNYEPRTLKELLATPTEEQYPLDRARAMISLVQLAAEQELERVESERASAEQEFRNLLNSCSDDDRWEQAKGLIDRLVELTQEQKSLQSKQEFVSGMNAAHVIAEGMLNLTKET